MTVSTLYCPFWITTHLPGSTCQGYLISLLGQLCSHCKWNAPGFEWNWDKIASSWWSWLGWLVLHQSVIACSHISKLAKPKGKGQCQFRCNNTLGNALFHCCLTFENWCNKNCTSTPQNWDNFSPSGRLIALGLPMVPSFDWAKQCCTGQHFHNRSLLPNCAASPPSMLLQHFPDCIQPSMMIPS